MEVRIQVHITLSLFLAVANIHRHLALWAVHVAMSKGPEFLVVMHKPQVYMV